VGFWALWDSFFINFTLGIGLISFVTAPTVVAIYSSEVLRLLVNRFSLTISEVKFLRASLTLASPVKYFSVAVGLKEPCDCYLERGRSSSFTLVARGFLKLY
jgi:hypothetical protein